MDAARQLESIGVPERVTQMVEALPKSEVCGRCTAFVEGVNGMGMCGERGLRVKATSQGCSLFVSSD